MKQVETQNSIKLSDLTHQFVINNYPGLKFEKVEDALIHPFHNPEEFDDFIEKLYYFLLDEYPNIGKTIKGTKDVSTISIYPIGPNQLNRRIIVQNIEGNCDLLLIFDQKGKENYSYFLQESTNPDIKKKLKAYFELQPQDSEKEEPYGKILDATYRDIVPVLAGIKPASYLDASDYNGLKEILSYIKQIQKRNPNIRIRLSNRKNGYNSFVIYNAEAVERVVDENEEIFEKFDLAHLTPGEIIGKIFGKKVPIRAVDHPEIQVPLGLLLGFDLASVQRFAKGEKWIDESDLVPLRRFGIGYKVSDITNPEVKNLIKKYQKLEYVILQMLDSGLTPFQICCELPKIDKIENIRIKTKRSSKKNLN